MRSSQQLKKSRPRHRLPSHLRCQHLRLYCRARWLPLSRPGSQRIPPSSPFRVFRPICVFNSRLDAVCSFILFHSLFVLLLCSVASEHPNANAHKVKTQQISHPVGYGPADSQLYPQGHTNVGTHLPMLPMNNLFPCRKASGVRGSRICRALHSQRHIYRYWERNMARRKLAAFS